MCACNVHQDWDKYGSTLPLQVNLMPSGKYLMEDFYYGNIAALACVSLPLSLCVRMRLCVRTHARVRVCVFECVTVCVSVIVWAYHP